MTGSRSVDSTPLHEKLEEVATKVGKGLDAVVSSFR